ncbi:MAG: HD domain-containing protein [Clostridiales bacterium]|nr:HD domain-containing protein [Clostridiales bacterium]
MKINLPKEVKKAIALLEAKGFVAYVVGGCVRDSVMGKEPADWDITTSAKPEQTAQSFKDYRTIETGIKHGTLTVLIDQMPLEITTFRIDGRYSDQRRPDSVSFTQDLKLDLSRRDFTVNALAYSPRTGLVDEFDGLGDIKNKVIRCVGQPDARFQEDALRILRALRFASVLDFEIEKSTAQSLFKNRALLDKISAERIQIELIKLLAGPAVERVLLYFRQVLFQIIPELSASDGFDQQDTEKHIFTVYEHIAHAVSRVKNEPHLRMAMLLHDVGKPSTFKLDENGRGSFPDHAAAGAEIALSVLKGLKFSKRFTSDVVKLVRYHDLKAFEEPHTLHRLLVRHGQAFMRDYLQIKRADLLSLSPQMAQKAKKIDELEVALNELIASDPCLELADLKLKGKDLLTLGLPPGVKVGQTLDFLFELVIDGKLENDKKALLEEAKKIIKAK